MCGVDDFVALFGRGRFVPQSPLKCDDAGVAMACQVGEGSVAESDARYWPVDDTVSRAG